MPYRRTTLAKFIIEDRRRQGTPAPELVALFLDVQRAIKMIAASVSYGALVPRSPYGNEDRIDAAANEIMLATCEWGGYLGGMASQATEALYPIPPEYPKGRYLLNFYPLEGSSNIDVNVAVGTIFSVLLAPEDVTEPTAEHFLQPGASQVAAGYALYGPSTMLVLTLGTGVHGFTLDREAGAFALTHPDMRIPDTGTEFAINASYERFWEAPVRRYVEECIQGKSGPRGTDFSMRWIASTVAEVHRILIRGGLFMSPRGTRDPENPGGLPLLYEANPMAMVVEQAGGAASTGRERILGVTPSELHQRVPLILGSRVEVERLGTYHEAHDRGEDFQFQTPLFNPRSLFRSS